MKKLLMMLVLLGGVIQMTAQNTSQPITLNFRNVSIQEFIKQIESRTNFTFIYRDILMDTKKDVSIQVSDKPLFEVVKIVLDQKGLEASYNNNTIVLTKKKEIVQPKTKIITGIVTDTNGDPIIGATVIDTEAKNGTITNYNGSFSLEVGENAVIQVSYIGYTQTEVKTGNQQNIDIKLREDVLALDEVIVVGYGTQKKINLTGAVSQINAEDIANRSAANLSQILQGVIPNLNVSFDSGRPGATGSFNIRGNTSLNGGAPLVLIDGIEGDVNRINPHDVESVTVLKDASASAVYGARASYGVILITTKEGKDNKVSVTYNGRWGWRSPTTSTDFETRGYYSAKINDQFSTAYSGNPETKYTESDYIELYKRINDKVEHPDRPWVVQENRNGRETYVYYANTDWYRYVYNTEYPMWENNLNISGGTANVNYMISSNYLKQHGMFKKSPDVFDQFNIRSKIAINPTPWLKIINNTKYSDSKYFFPGSGSVNNMFSQDKVGAFASYLPVNPDGTATIFTPLSNGNRQMMGGMNALLAYNKHYNMVRDSEFSTNNSFSANLLKGLSIKGNIAFTKYTGHTTKRNTNIPYSQYPGVIDYLTTGKGNNDITESFTLSKYFATNLYANYEHTFDNQNINLMFGNNYETRHIQSIEVVRDGVISDNLNDIKLAVGENITTSGSQNEYAIMGFFYRFNYDYKNKYLFETSGRIDGTSRFKRGQRYGYFPSLSAGWRISEEDFFGKLKDTFQNFKLRYSYGILGNQQVDYYSYMQFISINTLDSYSFGETTFPSYARESNPVSNNITWEKVISNNLGIDIGMINNKLNIVTEFYIRDTKDMLTKGKTMPASFGANEPNENAADLRTKGWEISIGWKDRQKLLKRNINYGISFILSDYTSKITRFDNPTLNIDDHYVGKVLGEIWGYHTDGYFTSDEEAKNYEIDQSAINTIINSSAGLENGLRAGDLKYLDLDNDNIITLGSNTVDNPGDRSIIGNSQPRYSYGINLFAQWYGFDLSLFLQGIGKKDWYPGGDNLLFWGPYARPYVTYLPRDFQNSIWSEDNPDAYFPRPRGYIALNQTRSLGAINDRYLQDLAYCRLKNLTVGYSLEKNWVNRLKIENIRFYFSGENLLTWTKLKNKYLDPELASANRNGQVYPWSKIFLFGLEVIF